MSATPGAASNAVTVLAGAAELLAPAGKTVQEIRLIISSTGNKIDPAARAYLGGEPMGEGDVPPAGSKITFIKKTGEKG